MYREYKTLNVRLPVAYSEALRIVAASRTLREHRRVTASEIARAALYMYYTSPAVLADMQATPAIFAKAKAEARAERKGENNGQ